MALADLNDINTYLPDDKVEATPDNVALILVSVDRMVKGYLASAMDSTTLATWTTPANTPKIIRDIAGEFTAALLYREVISEDDVSDVRLYPQRLYNEAMQKLGDVLAGKLVLYDLDEDNQPSVGVNFTTDDFFPRDSNPVFTMDKIL